MICPVCNGEYFATWGKTGAYTILTCSFCGLGVTSPFPSDKELRTTNEAIYEINQRIRTYIARRPYFEKRYKRYLANIKNFKQRGRLLDIGCNIGLFLNVAREEGFSVAGVELNNACADYARNTFHLEIHSDLLTNVSFDDRSFDVVTLFDVLEHVPDLHGLLTEIYRILKTGGLLVVQSPNLSSVMSKLTGSNWSWLAPPDHVYHFTPKSLVLLLSSHGFTPEQITTWEPAKDFSDNLITAIIRNSTVRTFLLMINGLTNIFTFPVFLFQRLWWYKYKGGLLEAYSTIRKENI